MRRLKSNDIKHCINWFNNKNYLKDVLFYFMKHDFMSPKPASNSLYRWGWPRRILLSPHSKCLDYRCMLLHLAQSWVFYVRYSTIPVKLETVNSASCLTQHALLAEPSSTVPWLNIFLRPSQQWLYQTFGIKPGLTVISKRGKTQSDSHLAPNHRVLEKPT